MITYKKYSNRLEVELPGDFNFNALKLISEKLGDRKELSIDLINARFVNTKAIIYMHRLITGNDGITLKLKNPPKLFFTVLHALDLHTIWDLDTIVTP